MNADHILFRCSSLSHIMTEPREKAKKERGELSETTITHLIDKYVSAKYGRETEITNKYIEKGLSVEEDSITLYSRIKKEFFKKNEAQLSNEFICGTPDLFKGESIYKADEVIDTKSPWDIFTFFRSKCKAINKDYYWQIQGYCALTGAKRGRLVYCLINTPAAIIYDEKRRLQWKMGVINPDNDKNYNDACDALEKAMTYDDIPMQERMFETIIERDDAAIEKLYQRVKDCRKYMNENFFNDLSEQLSKSISKEAA